MMNGLIINPDGFAYQKDLNILKDRMAALEAKAAAAQPGVCTCEVLEYNHNRTLVTLIVASRCPVHDVPIRRGE
jgi:hypothetical protein